MDLARHANLLFKLQHGLRNTEAPHNYDTTEQITNAEVLDAEVVISITSLRIHRRRLIRRARMHRPLDMDPRPPPCRLGNTSCNLFHNRFRRHRQRRELAMRHPADSVQRATT